MRNLLLGAGIASVCLLTSCDKETDSDGSSSGQTTTTVAQDKANISASMDEIVSCIGNMKNGSMVNSIVAFTGLSDGEAMKEDFIEAIFVKMEDAVDTISNPIAGKFNFDSYTGTWSYNAVDSSWSRATSPTNEIVVEFPSDDTQSTNNTVLSLKNYTDKKFVVDLEDIYLPKTVEFSITKDGTKIAGANLTTAVYEQNSDVIMPVDIEASVFLAPFTFTVSGERETSTKFVASVGWGDGSGCDYAMEAELNVAHNDYENLDGEDIVDIKGTVSHNDLLIDLYADVAKLISLDDDGTELTVAEANANVDAKIKYNGVKVAELVAVEDANEDVEIFVEYKDGTQENTSTYYEQMGDDLEALLSDLTGPWEDDNQVQ